MKLWMVLLIILIILIIALVVMYFLGKKAQAKQEEQQARVFDTSIIKKAPQSLIIGLFFCQLFCFII